METISTLGKTGSHQVSVTVHPWLADHTFAGRAVLPAVETMAILASFVKSARPETEVRRMREGRFEKFFAIPPHCESVRADIEMTTYPNGEIGAALLTRTRVASMTRVKVHGSLLFAAGSRHFRRGIRLMAPPQGPIFEVSGKSIYQELVPFGTAYRNIVGNLRLAEEGAEAQVRGPRLPVRGHTSPLGSPFPLDAAFHAACVWGQRFHNIVAFPVGLEGRVILRPTQPDVVYVARVTATAASSKLLVFDLGIFDSAGSVYEVVTGLRMRDVSGGRLRPPSWIRA